MSSNPLVADRTDSTTPLAGTFLLEDGEALVQAIESKDWVSGSLAVVSGVFDAAAAISDPLGTLFAMGIGWLLDHMEPFPTWLEQLTGDADQVRAHATTWQNVQEQMNQCAQSMTGYVKSDLADMSGQAISAYTGAADDVAKAINAAGSWAGAMGTALNITATIVQFVHDLVRDALAEIVGSILSYAAELVASAGTALPLVLQQIATRVASLVGRIGRNIEDLISSARNLVSKLGDLKALFKSLKDKLDDLFRGGKKGDSPEAVPNRNNTPEALPGSPSQTPGTLTNWRGEEVPDTIPAREAPKKYTAEDVERARENAYDPEKGGPVDPRTGAPLNEASGQRKWDMRYDPANDEWVAWNKGDGWGPDGRPVDFPDYDPDIGKQYTSGDGHYPGDYPPHSPPATYDPASGKPGVVYINRDNGTGDAWKDYQEQITGWKRTEDGIPEYAIPHPDGGDVKFDGFTNRKGTDVALDAKRGYEGLHEAYQRGLLDNPLSADDPAFKFAEKQRNIRDGLVAEAQRQLEVLPEGTLLEWHVSTRKGAAAIQKILGAQGLDDVIVRFTPEP